MTKKYVNYFGFGANKNPEMIYAIIGRKPDGFVSFIEDYELCVEKMSEINEITRKHLSEYWDDNFASYTVRSRVGAKVYGTVWKVTLKERDLIKNWELCGTWSRSILVVAVSEDGERIACETEIVENYQISQVVKTKNYPVYVARRAKMLSAARGDRKHLIGVA